MNTNWENEAIIEMQQIVTSLNDSQKNKYQIDLLERLIIRIAEFSNSCPECQAYKVNIMSMISQISDNDKILIKEYKINFSLLLKHMRHKHLIFMENEKQNELMALGMSFGLALGTGIGLIFGTFGMPIGSGLGMVIGMTIGLSVGANMDKKNREEGKII